MHPHGYKKSQDQSEESLVCAELSHTTEGLLGYLVLRNSPVVPRPAASASPGSVWAMQILGPLAQVHTLTATKSESAFW